MVWRITIAVIATGLPLTAVAQEGAVTPAPNCPNVIGLLEFANFVDVAVSATLIGDEGTEGSIARAFEALECLGEPVSELGLSALYFAQGINAFYLGQQERSHVALTRAYAIGGWSVLDERYGDGVLVPFDAAAAQLMQKGVLDISFLEPPSEAYLNGAAITSFGSRLISEMPYLLQWQDSSGWHNQLVEVAQGVESIAGGGSGTSSALEEQVSTSLFVASETNIRSAPTGRYSAGLLYSAGFAQFGHGKGALSGGAVAPGVVLSGDVVVADRVYLSSSARLAVPSSAPDFSSAIEIVVGGTQQREYFSWGAGVGPIFVPITTLLDGDIISENDTVAFDSSWSLGVGVKAFVEYADFRGSFDFQWTEGRKGMSGDIEYIFTELEPIEAQPFGRLAVESTSRETGFLFKDTALVLMIESGLIWSF